jgi:hypothetical protein
MFVAIGHSSYRKQIKLCFPEYTSDLVTLNIHQHLERLKIFKL